METNFSLKFTGLCAFVSNGSGYRVVLVNARDNPHGGMEPHVAALLLPVDQYDKSSTWKPTKSFDGSAAHFENSRMWAFYLDGEDLTLKAPGTEIPAPATADPTQPCPQFGVDNNSFAWVAKMADLGAPTMSADHYSGDHIDKVLARVDLPAGITPVTDDFALTSDRQNIIKWRFLDSAGNPSNAKSRPLAEVVGISLSVAAASSITIKSSAGPVLVLKPSSGRISAWLVNMPELDILSDRNDPKTPRKPDDHFAMFFGMAQNMGTAFIPTPSSLCGPSGTGQITNPKCPPALFASHA